jgi:hypothetical protein
MLVTVVHDAKRMLVDPVPGAMPGAVPGAVPGARAASKGADR